MFFAVVALSASAAATPDRVYIVGDFNDWALPEADDAHGALALEKSSDANDIFAGDVTIPAGALSFKMFYFDPASNEGILLGSQAGQFALCADEAGQGAEVTLEYHKAYSDDAPTIVNWTGGTLNISYAYKSKRGNATVRWTDAPVNTFTSSMWLIADTEFGQFAGQPSVSESDPNIITYEFVVNSLKKIYLSPSAEPADSDIKWGFYDAFNPAYYNQGVLVPNGNCLEFPENQTVLFTLEVNIKNHSYTYHGARIIRPITSIENIYLVGNITNWMSPIMGNEDFYNDFKLERVAPAVFEGTFEFVGLEGDWETPSSQFRFFMELDGWDSSSQLGSGYEDFRMVPINLDLGPYNGYYFMGGKSNWCIVDLWEPKTVTLLVNLNTQEVTFADVQNGVSDVKADAVQGEVRWFNLQGQPVANPTNGIFIKAHGSTVSKVFVP